MQTDRRIALLFSCVFVLIALPAQAVDRLRAGQWETNVNTNGRTRSHSACLSQGDADAMNADAASIRAVTEKQTAGVCNVKDVKVNGSQVVVTSVCSSKEITNTTNYHGDSYDSVSSAGSTIQAKRIGPCK